MVVTTCLAAVLALTGLALCLLGLAYRRLVYLLTTDGLEISWLGESLVVPYAAIDGIYTGQRLVGGDKGNPLPGFPRWPGIYVGPRRVRGIGRLHFFSTSPDPATLTVVTSEGGGVVVSARTPQDFRTALIDRVVQCGDTGESPAYARRPAHAAPWTTLRDSWFPGSLAAGVVLLLVGVGVVALGYNSLPEQIPLRFDAVGRPSQIGPRSDLLHLPLIGLIGLVANWAVGVWIHPRERLLARLLWLGAAIMQAVLVVAIIRLLQ
jgi:Protein of unknown function (DUF1648)/Bacterial PH domain